MGKVSDEWFAELSHKYETECMNLKTKITDLRCKIKELKSSNSELSKNS